MQGAYAFNNTGAVLHLSALHSTVLPHSAFYRMGCTLVQFICILVFLLASVDSYDKVCGILIDPDKSSKDDKVVRKIG